MMPGYRSIIAVCAAAILAAPAGAQLPKVKKDKSPLVKEWTRGPADIPPGHRPPPGMCRIWIDNVPPGHQPAPTDCATAVRTRPVNGRVIYGDDYASPGKSGGKTSDVETRNSGADAAKTTGKSGTKKPKAKKAKPDDGKI